MAASIQKVARFMPIVKFGDGCYPACGNNVSICEEKI